MTKRHPVTGVILAGGASKRMGRDKAFVEVAGAPMYEHVAAALLEATGRVLAVGRTEALPGLETIPDEPGATRGPLAGLVAAFGHLDTDVLLVAVDQPWLRVETLRGVVGLLDDDPVVPFDHGSRQVTCAVYPAGIEEAARKELREGGSIQSLLDVAPPRVVSEAEWKAWGEDGRSWFSADTEEALAEGETSYGSP